MTKLIISNINVLALYLERC